MGWTAGTIFGKLRGLNAKNRAYLELLLNWKGLRVDFQKLQGLFIKIARPKGYLLIWAIGSGSGGSDQRHAGPVALGRRRWLLRGGAG